MNPFIQMMLIYLGVVLLILFVVNIYTKGFLFKYMIARTKKSKGKILITVDAKYFSYFVVGNLIEDTLRYKTRNKRFTTLSLRADEKKDCVETLLGALWIRVDEEGRILKKNYEGVSGYDGEHFDDLQVRALNRSRLNDYKKMLQMIVIVAGIGAFLALVAIIMVTQAKKQIIMAVIDSCSWKTLGNATVQYAGNVVTGGNMV